MTPDVLKQRIETLVEEQRDAIVAALRDLLKFRTVGGDADAAAEAAYRAEIAKSLDFLSAQAAAMGFTWRNHDNLLAVAELPHDGPFVALPVHVDVVPPGDGWSHDPFAAEVADDVIYGRGCQDDKGPVIQCLFAMKVLKDLGLTLRRGARLVVGTAEEFGDWPDMQLYPKVEPAPEFAIVSDAGFPIVNGEKGMLNLRVRAELPAGEDDGTGGYRLKSARSGERANIVPPHAELAFAGDASSEPDLLARELERFLSRTPDARAVLSHPAGGHDAVIQFTGRSAHGSTPQEGHSALLDMLRFMTASAFLSDDEADLATFLLEAGEDITGDRINIASNHEFIGPTTVNLGVLRWELEDRVSGGVPETIGKVEVILNIRPTMGLPAKEAADRASREVADYAEETGFTLTAEPFTKALDAIWVDPEKHPEFIGALKESYTAITGREAALSAIGGTTYAKAFPCAVCFGPVDPAEEEELAHQVDERLAVAHLLRNVKIYALALARLCGA